MIGVPAIKNLIREGNVHHIQNVIETGSKYGMQSMDQAVVDLYRKRFIDKSDVVSNIKDKEREEIKEILE